MNTQIKAIILDVDGVIVGEKIGFNSPYPHPQVTSALKAVQDSGIPISLCTAKPHFAIDKIIKDADLDNVHITDGGGVIIDPIKKLVVKKNVLPSKDAIDVLNTFLDAGVYVEFYTVDDYFIQSSQVGEITNKHAHVIQSKPQQVDSLVAEAEQAEITKIMPIAVNEEDKPRVQKLFEPFKNKLVLSWGVHPVILPLQFGIITAPGISKKQGAIEISQTVNVSLENILGVGDSESDWQFMGMCGYVAVMGNAKQNFKDMATADKKDNAFIAPSVDENGILEVFKHFKLI
jgi:hydroxymethylpyrimidine pyrophosphatase-like HAD family hydrolase